MILLRLEACELKQTRVINQSELPGRKPILWGYVNYGWRCLLGNLLGTEESQLDSDPANGYFDMIGYLRNDTSDVTGRNIGRWGL